MAIEIIVLVFAIVFPGAFALNTWDFVVRSPSRPYFSILGLGAFLGFLPYSVLQILGYINFDNIMHDDELILRSMLSSQNIKLFLAITIVWGSAGALVGGIAISKSGSAIAQNVLKRTLHGSNWIEVTMEPMDGNHEVIIETANGRLCKGKISLIPDEANGFVTVATTKVYDVSSKMWMGTGADNLILRISDIHVIQYSPHTTPTAELLTSSLPIPSTQLSINVQSS